jgi:hypothetical protein|tara:strand:- start:264 stop:521 length:258 start_codon:yes stop_codon:yes gene_type:complete
MRKNIDIDETTLTKLKVLSVFENMSVKSLMEKAVSFFVTHKENEKINSMTDEEKEDLGLLLLMQQADKTDSVSESEVMNALNKIQ